MTLKHQLGAASNKATKLQTEIKWALQYFEYANNCSELCWCSLLLDQLAEVTPQPAEVDLEEVDGDNGAQMEPEDSAGAEHQAQDGIESANASAAPLTEHPKRPREGEVRNSSQLPPAMIRTDSVSL